MAVFGWRGTDPDGSPSLQFSSGTPRVLYVSLDNFPENGTLDSIGFHNAFDDTSDSIRVALYVGGSATDSNGATLVEDLGLQSLTSGTWNTINSTTNPSLTSGLHYWIALKGNPATGSMYLSLETSDPGTNDLDGRDVIGGTESTDENNAWDATVDSTGATLNSSRYNGVRLNYTASASSSAGIAGINHGLVGRGLVNGGLVNRSMTKVNGIWQQAKDLWRPRLVPVGIAL